jgi:tRNA threonylcarbamoyladenosine modification (KEOPS) complex  Pcc1 subunit
MNTNVHEATYSVNIKIPFPSTKTAQIVCKVLSADVEKGNSLTKTVQTTDQYVLVKLESNDLKLMRSVVNAVLESLELIVSTMEEFHTE